MSAPILYHCRTDGCPNWISFHSDTFIPKEWTCPACEHALEQQMVEDIFQRELAAKLTRLADAKERDNMETK